jgi:hypothetical protein
MSIDNGYTRDDLVVLSDGKTVGPVMPFIVYSAQEELQQQGRDLRDSMGEAVLPVGSRLLPSLPVRRTSRTKQSVLFSGRKRRRTI